MNLSLARQIGLRHAQFLQHPAHGADIGNAKLEQIGTNKGGKCQPPVGYKQGTGVDAQDQRDQDEATGKEVDVTIYGHGLSLGLNQWWV
jgi:hypothetical protein